MNIGQLAEQNVDWDMWNQFRGKANQYAYDLTQKRYIPKAIAIYASMSNYNEAAELVNTYYGDKNDFLRRQTKGNVVDTPWLNELWAACRFNQRIYDNAINQIVQSPYKSSNEFGVGDLLFSLFLTGTSKK